MANNFLGTNFDFTYDGIISSGIILEDALENPDLRSVFRVDGNIKSKKQLTILGRSGKALKGKQLCGTQVPTGTINNAYNRTLEVKPLEMYLEQCSDIFRGTVVEMMIGAGFNEDDLTNTELFQEVIVQYTLDWLREEAFRIASFGDTSNPPAGAADYYNMLDGIWPSLIAAAATYDVVATRDSISTLNQSSGTRAIDYFQELMNNCDVKLKQRAFSENVFLVTGNVFENYRDYLANQNLDTSIIYLQNGVPSRDPSTGGIPSLQYLGIPVIPVYAWDEWIATDNLGNNTRILYTKANNHVIGLGDNDAWDQIQFWFDPNTKKNKIRAQFRMGYQYVQPNLTAIAYGNV